MGLLILLVLLVLSLSHWLLEPLLRALTPALSAAWLAWAGLPLALWLLAGAASDQHPVKRKP